MKGLARTRAGSWVLGVLCLIGGAISGVYFFGMPVWADSIQQAVGAAGRDPVAVNTWRYLTAYRMDDNAGTGTPISTTDRALATYSMLATCADVTCANLTLAGATNKTGNLFSDNINIIPSLAVHPYFRSADASAFRRASSGTTDVTTLGGVSGDVMRGSLNVIPLTAQGQAFDDGDVVDGSNGAGRVSVVPGLFTGVGNISRWRDGVNFAAEGNTGTGMGLVAMTQFADTFPAGWRRYRGGASPVQGGGHANASTVFNSQTTGAANTAVVTTIAAGVANEKAHVYKVTARCSAGTSSLTVASGGTTIWTSETGAVGTTNFREEWATGLTATAIASAMDVTLAACGAGNTGTLIVQADRF